MTIDGEIGGYYAVIHFPHPKVKNMKRGHRLIIHPQYQGFGYGEILSSYVGKYYTDNGYRFRATSTHPGLVYRRLNSPRWEFIHKKENKDTYEGSTISGRFSAGHRTTYTFEFIKDQEIQL